MPDKEILTIDVNDTLKSYLIPKEAKPKLRSELSLLRIDDFNTYGDLEALARTLKKNTKLNNRYAMEQ